MCLALGLTVAGCEMSETEMTPAEETAPAMDVDVEGEAVEVVLPPEAVEAIEAAMEEAEAMPEEVIAE